MNKRYIVKLDKQERKELSELVKKERIAAKKRTHAQVLLLADASKRGPAWKDEAIAEACRVTVQTVENIRKRLVLEGLESALTRKKQVRPSRVKILDGEKEAQVVALCCGAVPSGHARWTLRLLAERVVELDIVEAVSHETVRQCLKKNALKPWQKSMWCIPPKHNAEFVYHMENVLEAYKRPYDASFPLICMDELSKQLTIETQTPLPAAPGRRECFDYEYERNGTANVFAFTEPLTGWRHLVVTDHRTKTDWAEAIRELVDVHRPKAKRITLVMDNLNTHSLGSLYEAFPPQEARRLIQCLDVVHTPKHGSWLNMAEIELNVLTRQCLARRIPDKQTLKNETAAWEKERNGKQAKIDWQFKTDDARIKLKHLYPKNQC